MKTTYQKIFLGLSLLFMAGIFVFFFLMLSATQRNVVFEVRDYMERRISAAERNRTDLMSNFIDGILAVENNELIPRLRFIMVYSNNDEVIDLYAQSSEYVSRLPQDLTRLRGEPDIDYNAIYEALVVLDGPGENRIFVVFQALETSDLEPILIQILYYLIGFASFTVLYILLSIIFSNGGGKGSDQIEYKSAVRPTSDDNFTGSESDASGEKSTSSPLRDESKGTGGTSDSWIAGNKSARQKQGKALREEIWPGELLLARLHNEIERSAELESDIALVVVRQGRRFRADADLSSKFKNLLISHFRYQDMLFELNSSSFAVILPNHSTDETRRSLDKLLIHSAEEFSHADDIMLGFSTRSGRLMDSERLVREAIKASKIAGPRKGQIVAFKPDPGKYRQQLMNQKS